MLAVADLSALSMLGLLPLLAAPIDDPIVIQGIGVVITVDALCSLVALDDGRVYAIEVGQPPVERLAPGTRLRIEGVPVHKSVCRKGQSLSLRRIEVLIEHDDAGPAERR